MIRKGSKYLSRENHKNSKGKTPPPPSTSLQRSATPLLSVMRLMLLEKQLDTMNKLCCVKGMCYLSLKVAVQMLNRCVT
jgi:hypothetical protein